MQEHNIEKYGELQEHIDIAQSYYSDDYNQMELDSSFASGEQFDNQGFGLLNIGNVRSLRKRGRKAVPIAVNLIDRYIKRVVNPIRMTPYTVEIDGPYREARVVKEAVQQQLRKCRADEAIERAYESSVTTGRGFFVIDTDYDRHNREHQVIKVTAPTEQRSVYIDPSHERIDGADSEWGIVLGSMPLGKSKQLYGEDVDGGSAYPFVNIEIPPGHVPCITHYVKSYESMKEQVDVNGEDIENDNGIQSITYSEHEVCKVHVRKWVGTELVSETELVMDAIPIIPVYGKRRYLDGKWTYRGMVWDLRDLQTLFNYYNQSELELITAAPKSTWIIASQQAEGHEKQWANANAFAADALQYEVTDVNGTPIPPPQRVDNSAQIQHFLIAKAGVMATMGAAAGIQDGQLGGVEGDTSQSGRAIDARNLQGEFVTADYADNLAASIEHMGSVILQMFSQVWGGSRPLTIENDNGDLVTIEVDLSDIDLNQYLPHVSSGPAMESRRKESIRVIQDLGQTSEAHKAASADLMAGQSDSPIAKELQKRFRKLVPPGVLDDGGQQEDPEAVAMLGQQQQQIQQQEQIINQMGDQMKVMYNELIDGEKDRQQKMQEAILKSETVIEKALIDAEAKITDRQMQEEGEDGRQTQDIIAELRATHTKAKKDMLDKMTDIITKDMDNRAQVNLIPTNMVPGEREYPKY